VLLILYGPPGSGKNFVGEWLACKYDFYFYDADLHLTQDMKQCLYNKRAFTQAMRNHFFDIVIDNIKRLQCQHMHLVMAQAISRKINRKQLQIALPEAQFIHIDASLEIRQKRLSKRDDWVTPDWVDKLLLVQEKANKEHFHLNNNRDGQYISQQIETMFSQLVSQ